MDLPLIRIDQVFHVGSLDRADRTRRASLEAHCLSVSIDPEEWGSIARISGPCWSLSRAGALWIDACNLSDAQEAGLLTWAVAEGLAEPVTIWRTWHFDDEADTWACMTFGSRAEALHELGADARDDTKGADTDAGVEIEDEGCPSNTGTRIDALPGFRLTPLALERLERWHDPFEALYGAVILFADLGLAASNPDLVGVWWDEIFDPLSLSCPRGGILPDRIATFRIARGGPDGDLSPVT